MDDFGSFLRSKRQQKGLTLQQLSNLLSKEKLTWYPDVPQLSRWETSDALPRPNHRPALLAIAKILDMDDSERNEFLVMAGLSPLQPDEVDIDALLLRIGPERWRKTYYLRKFLGWDEKRTGEKLSIAFFDVRKDMEMAEREMNSLVIDKGKGRPLRVLIGDDYQDLAARLKRDIEGFNIRDNYAVWQFADNPWAFQESTRAELQYTLDVIPYLGGSKVVGFKIEKEKGCTVVIERMKEGFPTFAAFDQFKGHVARLVDDSQTVCREIWSEAESVPGLKMGSTTDVGYGYLIDVPFYIWRFALENYDSPKSPELEPVLIDVYHAYLTPRERPGWAIAVGLTQAMVACQEQTRLLCERYVQDPRIGELLEREKDVKKQAEPLLQALSKAITPFFE